LGKTFELLSEKAAEDARLDRLKNRVWDAFPSPADYGYDD
jgi:hypothetical protein